MEKTNEIKRASYTAKWYSRSANEPITVIIQQLNDNNEIEINYVQVSEDVDQDAKEVSGSYNIDMFLRKYDQIKSLGSNLSYKVVMDYNDLSLTTDFYEDSDIVVLSTPDPSLEIDDLIQKKNKGLGL